MKPGACEPVAPLLHPISPGLVFVQRGWLNGNHLVDTGPPATLVDTAYIGQLDATLGLIAEAGVEPAAVERIVTTHLHCDHVGAHARLHQLGGCKILAHPACRRALAMRDARATWHGFYAQDYAWFPTHGDLNDGDTLELGGRRWVCLHTPGHAAGHLCLFDPEQGDLIAADAVWDADFGVITPQVEGWDAPLRLRESLRRLARLPVSRVWPGHGPPISDGPAAIAACLQRVERFIAEPRLVFEDQMRKILLYTVLMRGPLGREPLWELVRAAPWFGEVCRDGFLDPPRMVFERFLDQLAAKGLLDQSNGVLSSGLEA